MIRHVRQIAIFGAVGCTAALIHLAVVRVLVEGAHWHAIAANVPAFGVAFLASFGGHSRFTFPVVPSQRAVALRRFFIVAVIGFLVNQALFTAGLKLAGDEWYFPLLAVVIVMVAGMTFVLSKLWAFARDSHTADGV
jgi:putative flippase GtrA